MKTESTFAIIMCALLSACDGYWGFEDSFKVNLTPSGFVDCINSGDRDGTIKIFAREPNSYYGYAIVFGPKKNIEGDINYSNGRVKLFFSSNDHNEKLKPIARAKMNQVKNYLIYCSNMKQT